MQRESGVKDSTAQRWIELLLAKADEQQKQVIFNPVTRDPRLSNRQIRGDARKAIVADLKAEIQGKLFEWLIQQPPELYAKLPPDSRESARLTMTRSYSVML